MKAKSGEANKGMVSLDLDELVLATLHRINDEGYLAYSLPQIEACRSFAGQVGGPFRLVEIGSNRGWFSTGLARNYRDETVLGLERREKWVLKARARAQREGLENLHYLQCDARIALPILVAEASVRMLFVLFPDPWWKRRHQPRRLLDAAFLDFLAERLEPGGVLCIKTDVRLVYESVLYQALGVRGLRPLNPLDWPDEREWVLSHRERTCLANGSPVFRLFFTRPDDRTVKAT